MGAARPRTAPEVAGECGGAEHPSEGRGRGAVIWAGRYGRFGDLFLWGGGFPGLGSPVQLFPLPLGCKMLVGSVRP